MQRAGGGDLHPCVARERKSAPANNGATMRTKPDAGAMKALLVGVAPEAATVVRRALGARGHEPIVANDGAAGLEVVLRESPALIVVQDPLADMTASDFCRQTRACSQGADAVILVITARDDELPAVLDAGATDLHTTALGPAALETRVLIVERLVSQHARLRDRELRFRRLFESGVAGVIISDFDGNFKEANDAFLRLLGYTRDEMLAGKLTWGVISPLDRLVPDTEERAQLRSTGFLPLREEECTCTRTGDRIAALVGSAALEGTAECITYVTDISARRRRRPSCGRRRRSTAPSSSTPRSPSSCSTSKRSAISR